MAKVSEEVNMRQRRELEVAKKKAKNRYFREKEKKVQKTLGNSKHKDYKNQKYFSLTNVALSGVWSVK
jgi:hypothetical protein